MGHFVVWGGVNSRTLGVILLCRILMIGALGFDMGNINTTGL